MKRLARVCTVAALAASVTIPVVSGTATAAPPDPQSFGRLFPALPGFAPDSAAINALGADDGQMEDPNRTIPAVPNEDSPVGETSVMTYFGQFVDHDVTLDQAPLVDGPVDIATLRNGRTPALDLDSVYGGGPTVSPQLYDETGRFILSQAGRDHQRREDGSAVLVEGRNDENLIIAQIHVAFERFHNAQIDKGLSFAQAKRVTTQHYQWIVLRDFLPTITSDRDVLAAIARNIAGRSLYKGGMPVEFSVAGYRFGHSMVRRAYRVTRGTIAATQVFVATAPGVTPTDLRGGRPIPDGPTCCMIAWENFATVPGIAAPALPTLNLARKIDTLLSSGLFVLPPGAINGAGPVVLAQRNMIRGKSYGLPSGQAVAASLGLAPLSNEQIGLTDPAFNGEAPLWFYLLAEAALTTDGASLGPVGSRIVLDTFVGMLRADSTSILRQPFAPRGGLNYRIGQFLLDAGVVTVPAPA